MSSTYNEDSIKTTFLAATKKYFEVNQNLLASYNPCESVNEQRVIQFSQGLAKIFRLAVPIENTRTIL